ncbi:helix-turn-helix domain-containing protein [uncultured Cyclobacterium sp.]|uniref:winged helix-turn-helix transcriptional regulator n=1 Tax=uncultured Cyclobacterium sp. TaxID=453820 RepID=UPI0030EF8AA9|tara:strand:+ start:263430 stop:263807 length:378 start_codon:yes stop_codon:yes gene_type:complete
MSKKIFEKNEDFENCPVRNVIDRIGDKWSVLIILLLEEEQVLRFNEIHKSIGTISQKMLTVTLKSLESDGLVKRTVFPQIPPKVEYELTPRGKSLLPHLFALTEWANNNMSDIKVSREQYFKVNS